MLADGPYGVNESIEPVLRRRGDRTVACYLAPTEDQISSTWTRLGAWREMCGWAKIATHEC